MTFVSHLQADNLEALSVFLRGFQQNLTPIAHNDY